MNKTTEKAMLSAANRIIKSAKRIQSYREFLHGVFVQPDQQGETRYCICDGYRAVRFKDEWPLEMAPANNGEPISLNNVVHRLDGDIEVAAPDAVDLKAYSKEHKGEAYRLDDNFGVWVNAAYLLDMLSCLPGAKIYVASKYSPVYFEADNGDGVLMPIRRDED